MHALVDYTKVIAIPDDLESFFHVMLYFAIRFLPHNCPDGVDRLLVNYFDDYTDGMQGFTAGPAKSAAMHSGEIDITLITGGKKNAEGKTVDERLQFLWPRNNAAETENATPSAKQHPIDALITELLGWFRALYAQDKPDDVPPKSNHVDDDDDRVVRDIDTTYLEMIEAELSSDPSSTNDTAPRELTESQKEELRRLAQKLETHHAMERLLSDYIRTRAWPAGDKGDDKKPKKGYSRPKENIAITSTRIGSAKRPLDGGEGPSSKRVRSGS